MQRNATGALLNMTHSEENRHLLVSAGAMSVLVSLLTSPDIDVQYYAATAISNLAVDESNRLKLSQTEPRLVNSLVLLLDSNSLRVCSQAALALRNLASDSKYQLEIVQRGGLIPILRLLQSDNPVSVTSAAACIRNISIHPENESIIVESGFLTPLVHFISEPDNEEVQCHCISTLRNLAASSESNRRDIVLAGALEKFAEALPKSSEIVQSEITACIAVLALADEFATGLRESGLFPLLIDLTKSSLVEVQGNAAAALGNISSREENHYLFKEYWNREGQGIQDFIESFLDSKDDTFKQIAAWTLMQLAEGNLQILYIYICIYKYICFQC